MKVSLFWIGYKAIFFVKQRRAQQDGLSR